MKTIIVKCLKGILTPNQIKFLNVLYGRLNSYRFCDLIWGKRILSSKPVILDNSSTCEIHMLACKRDFLSSLWCLKTFYHYSGLRTGLVIHEDGSLDENNIAIFQKHFVGCKVIARKDADIEMKKLLKNHEFCSKYRFSDIPFAIKLFDFIHYSRSGKILLMDSDVLFFREPREIIQCIASNIGFFMHDCQSAYSFSSPQIKSLFNTQIRHNVNAGILYIRADMMCNLDFIESFLEVAYKNGWPNPWFLEQTLWALLATKHREFFVRLPKTYQISRDSITDNTICHHFINNGSRHHFYRKGVRHLMRTGCGINRALF